MIKRSYLTYVESLILQYMAKLKTASYLDPSYFDPESISSICGSNMWPALKLDLESPRHLTAFLATPWLQEIS